jgi:hypothetical protein
LQIVLIDDKSSRYYHLVFKEDQVSSLAVTNE